jgi:hypothetical protein
LFPKIEHKRHTIHPNMYNQFMEYRWNATKDAALRGERQVGFDDVVKSLSLGGLLATMLHPNTDKYPQQHI